MVIGRDVKPPAREAPRKRTWVPDPKVCRLSRIIIPITAPISRWEIIPTALIAGRRIKAAFILMASLLMGKSLKPSKLSWPGTMRGSKGELDSADVDYPTDGGGVARGTEDQSSVHIAGGDCRGPG